MAKSSPSTSQSITNRSPWLVEVRGKASLAKRFSYPNKALAAAYLADLLAEGHKARLTQLEESFLLNCVES